MRLPEKPYSDGALRDIGVIARRCGVWYNKLMLSSLLRLYLAIEICENQTLNDEAILAYRHNRGKRNTHDY